MKRVESMGTGGKRGNMELFVKLGLLVAMSDRLFTFSVLLENKVECQTKFPEHLCLWFLSSL